MKNCVTTLGIAFTLALPHAARAPYAADYFFYKR